MYECEMSACGIFVYKKTEFKFKKKLRGDSK